MSKTPFFSIVIPTKNRPDYLCDSITSVLKQSFTDLELVVSDNFNDEKTERVISPFREDSRLVSIKTDRELNMLDHWEFATSHAKGKYIILLTDRKLLYQNSLTGLKHHIDQHPNINVFSFSANVYNESKKQVIRQNYKPTSLYKSTYFIKDFLDHNLSFSIYNTYYPKTLNGCYKNTFAAKVRDVAGSYFNIKGVSTPDFSSAFINLGLNDEVLFINGPYLLTQGEAQSNGRNFGDGDYRPYMSTLNADDMYGFVPMKIPFIYNLLMNDYFVINSTLGFNVNPDTFDWSNYYACNYFELVRKEESKILGDNELKAFREIWTSELNKLNKCRQEKVHRLIAEAEIDEFDAKLHYFRDFRSHIKDYIRNNFTEKSLIRRIIKSEQTALQAAGFNRSR